MERITLDCTQGVDHTLQQCRKGDLRKQIGEELAKISIFPQTKGFLKHNFAEENATHVLIVFRSAVLLGLMGRADIKIRNKDSALLFSERKEQVIESHDTAIALLRHCCAWAIPSTIDFEHTLTHEMLTHAQICPRMQRCFQNACDYLYSITRIDYGEPEEIKDISTENLHTNLAIFLIAMASYVWILEKNYEVFQTSKSAMEFPDETPFISRTVYVEGDARAKVLENTNPNTRKTLTNILVNACALSYYGSKSPFNMVEAVMNAKKEALQAKQIHRLFKKQDTFFQTLSHQTQ
jgi:hypothetical protein